MSQKVEIAEDFRDGVKDRIAKIKENAVRNRVNFYKRIKMPSYKFRKMVRYGVTTFMAVELVNDIFLVDRPGKYAEVLHDVHVMLAVSTGQMAFTSIAITGEATEKEIRIVNIARHLDWIISGSLQLRTYWKFAQIHGWEGPLLKLLAPFIIMILSLYLVDLGILSPKIGYVISLAGLALVIKEMWRIKHFLRWTKNIVVEPLAIFFYMWILYIIPRFCKNFELRDSLYVILDGIQRVGYTAVLVELIRKYP